MLNLLRGRHFVVLSSPGIKHMLSEHRDTVSGVLYQMAYLTFDLDFYSMILSMCCNTIVRGTAEHQASISMFQVRHSPYIPVPSLLDIQLESSAAVRCIRKRISNFVMPFKEALTFLDLLIVEGRTVTYDFVKFELFRLF